MNGIIKDNARFTVLTPGAVRIEYATDGAFLDGDTFFARRGAPSDAAVTEEEGVLRIESEKFTLVYRGGAFSRDTLSVRVHTAGVDTLWRHGDKPNNNLGGTLSTLDGVWGAVPLPDGLISRDGFYVFDDSGSAVISEGTAKTRNTRHKVDLYFFAYGHDYRAALSDLAAVSGKFALPRKYFFGAWYSRWHAYTDREYLAIVDEYDYNGFPIDVMVIDMDWHPHSWDDVTKSRVSDFGYGHAGGNLGWTGYSWVKERFPDPAAFLSALHKRGVAATLNDHPADGVRSTDDCYDDFIARLDAAGYTEKVPTAPLSSNERSSDGKRNYRFNPGDPDYMRAFFEAAHRPREREGVDFWWLDWQQDYIYPEVNGVKGLSNLKWLNELYYKDSERDGKRGLNFSRWAGVGDQRHPGYFSGDANTCFETLDFEVAMTVSAGNAGCFFWSHDVGGFYDGATPKQAECFARWMQFGAVSAAMRVHSCGDTDRRPWLWGEPFSSSMRESARLRARLFPYIYSSAYHAAERAVPLLRPLYFDMPEDERAYNCPTTYMLGDSLLVSPIISRGKGERFTAEKELFIPRGVWYGVFDGKRYTEGVAKVFCDIYSFPLYAAAGVPVPCREYSGRMTAPAGRLVVHVYADPDAPEGKTTLYEDDGISKLPCACRKTAIVYTEKDGKHTLTLTPSGEGYEGEMQTRSVSLVLHGVAPGSGSGDTAYDDVRRIATVTVNTASPARSLSITYET